MCLEGESYCSLSVLHSLPLSSLALGGQVSLPVVFGIVCVCVCVLFCSLCEWY